MHFSLSPCNGIFSSGYSECHQDRSDSEVVGCTSKVCLSSCQLVHSVSEEEMGKCVGHDSRLLLNRIKSNRTFFCAVSTSILLLAEAVIAF